MLSGISYGNIRPVKSKLNNIAARGEVCACSKQAVVAKNKAVLSHFQVQIISHNTYPLKYPSSKCRLSLHMFDFVILNSADKVFQYILNLHTHSLAFS